MLQNRVLNVFSTGRKIRKFLSSFGDEFLPKTMSLGDFFDNCKYVENLQKADELEQIKFMFDAVSSVKSIQKSFGFSQNFFEFLKNKEYLFSFFKEIVINKKSISDLKNKDIYAQYDEHLEILNVLFDKYFQILKNKNLYDEITINQIYKINYEFLQNFNLIKIEIDGVLSEVELDILSEVSKICEVEIYFFSSVLNDEILVKKLENLSGLLIKIDQNDIKFSLNLNQKRLVKLENPYKNVKILHKEFENENLMAAYVFEKISTFLNQGIKADEICVVLPDENFSKILQDYDINNLLNFAMGKSLKDTIFYEILDKLIQNATDKNFLNISENYLENLYYKTDEMFFYMLKIPCDFIKNFIEIYDKFCDFEEFSKIILEVLNFSQLQNVNFDDVFFQIENFLKDEKQKFKDILQLFINLIEKISLDDIGGGKVVVMGVLESRGMDFKAVIIPCFDDDNVPKRSQNDMFLNSKIREKAGFVSFVQRENLQRFYYKNLIYKSEITAIANIKNDEKNASRFLKKFDVIKDEDYSDDDYFDFFTNLNQNLRPKTEICDYFAVQHDFFDKPLSFSRLKTFLDCKRKYFYAYVKKISQLKSFCIEANLKGTILHESLSEVYEKNKTFVFSYFKEIYTKSAKKIGLNEIEIALNLKKFEFKFSKEMQNLEKLGYKFYKSEFKQNQSIFEISKDFKIKLDGKIDRIDKKNDEEFLLIDYKSGKVDKNSFQLAFYEALLDKKCEKKFFNIKDMKFEDANKTIDDLKETILSIKSDFDQGIKYEKNEKSCVYCAYKIICKGEI